MAARSAEMAYPDVPARGKLNGSWPNRLQRAYGRLLCGTLAGDARIVLNLAARGPLPPAQKYPSAVVHLTALPEPRFPRRSGRVETPVFVAARLTRRRKDAAFPH